MEGGFLTLWSGRLSARLFSGLRTRLIVGVEVVEGGSSKVSSKGMQVFKVD